MPAAIVAIGAAVAGAAATSAAVSIGMAAWMAAMVGAVVAVGVSFVGSMLFGLNKTAKGSTIDAGVSDRSETVRQAITYRRTVYGEVMISGPLTYMYCTSNKRKLYVLITLAGHPLSEIGDLYLDGELVELVRAAPWSAGSYSAGSVVYYDGKYYSRTSTAYPKIYISDINNQPEWTGQYRVSDAPSSVPTLWTETTAPAGGKRLGTGDYADVLTVWTGDGTTAGDADLLAAMMAASSEWTAAHKQLGCSKLLLELVYSSTAYSNGLPTIKVLVKGKEVYDPRTGETAYSCNPALVLRDYLTGDHGLVASADDIDDAMISIAADVCDQQVALADGTSEARYEAHGTVDDDTARGAALEKILSAMAGYASWSGGQWLCWAGAASAPVADLDEDDLDGPLSVTAFRSRASVYNSLRATFVNRDNYWEQDDLPPRIDEGYVAEDGESIWDDLSLEYTTKSSHGQRLQKIALERNRQQMTVSYPCKLSALPLRAGDVIRVSNERRGWVGKTFLLTKWALAVRGDAPDMRIGIDLTLQECTANGSEYAWDPSEEVDQSVDATLSTPSSAPTAPASITVTSQPYAIPGGAMIPGLLVSWPEPDDASVVGYLCRWRLDGATAWAGSVAVDGASVFVWPLTSGAAYRVEVASRNYRGGLSGYAAPASAVIAAGDTTPPAAVTGLTASVSGQAVSLSWLAPSDDDFRLCSVYRDGLAVAQVYGLPGGAMVWSESGAAVGSHTYGVQALDAEGNASALATTTAIIT